jgi:protein-tyrosine phosphatase
LTEPTKILFVCLGNIVRSPLAENVFRHLAEEAGVGDRYVVDSAGTGAWHVGEAPDSRMVRVAAQHGLNYSGRARQFERRDLDDFDLLVAMDRDNRATLYSMARKTGHQDKIHLLREFDPKGKSDAEVPDPYYGGQEGFQKVYEIIERSCRNLLEKLENGALP